MTTDGALIRPPSQYRMVTVAAPTGAPWSSVTMPVTVNGSPFEREGDGGWGTVDALGIVGDSDFPPHPPAASTSNMRAALQPSLVICLVSSENRRPQSDPTTAMLNGLDETSLIGVIFGI